MNIEEINQKIKELSLVKNEKDKLERQLDNLRLKLDREKNEYYRAKRNFEKESNDVSDFENNKVKGVLLSLVGKKNEVLNKEVDEMNMAERRMQKEEEEYLEAKQEYDILVKKKKVYNDVDLEIETLRRQKLEIILNENGKTAEAIKTQEKEIEEKGFEIERINQVIFLADSLMLDIENMGECLGRARRTASNEAFFGSNLYSEMREHRNYDRARQFMYEAKSKVSRLIDMTEPYRNPLSMINLRVDVNEFDMAMDVFVDNRYSDREMVMKADSSLMTVENAIEIVAGFIDTRRRMVEDCAMGIKGKKEKIIEIIEKYGMQEERPKEIAKEEDDMKYYFR